MSCCFRYTFSQGYRLVVPFVDIVKYGVKDVWIGKPLGQVLRVSLPFLSRELLLAAFHEERVLINGRPVAPSHSLSAQERLGYVFHRHEPAVLDEPIEVLHIDRELVVVNKPCSIPVHPIGRFKRNTVTKILKEDYPELLADGNKLNVVHSRLDRLTSGVLILARTHQAAVRLVDLFRERLITKEYLARVKGTFPSGLVVVGEPIAQLQEQPPTFGTALDGKPALTEFQLESVLEGGAESIVRCRPLTGRTHQIRVHLQWLGHPIVNDYKYGGKIDFSSVKEPPEPVDYPKMVWCPECRLGRRDTVGVSREELASHSIFLHAHSYTYRSPPLREENSWTFTSPRPAWTL